MKKFITILLLTISIHAFSQDDPADGDGTVPIDGGLSLLLAAGAAFAGRKLYRQGAKCKAGYYSISQARAVSMRSSGCR